MPSGGVCSSAGFYCSDVATSFGCWGHEGHQVLDTLNLSYESLTSEDERLFDAAILLIMVAVLKIAYVFVLWSKVSGEFASYNGRKRGLGGLVGDYSQKKKKSNAVD